MSSSLASRGSGLKGLRFQCYSWDWRLANLGLEGFRTLNSADTFGYQASVSNIRYKAELNESGISEKES